MNDLPHFRTLIEEFDKDSRPWLIIGKGPSLALWEPRFLSVFHCVAINHAVRRTNVPTLHVYDYDNWTDIDLDCLNARYIVMPSVPHWRRRPQNRYDYEAGCLVPEPATLKDYVFHDYRLRQVQAKGRLYSYDVDRHGPLYYPDETPLEVCGASGVPILHALALAGHTHVYTIGIDGGDGYAANTFERECVDARRAYDLQVERMGELAKRHGVQWTRISNGQPPARWWEERE